MLELGEYAEALHEQVGENVAKYGIHQLIAIGNFAENIKKGAVANGMSTSHIKVYQTLEEMLEEIENEIEAGDAVLVKASRGMHFEKIVEKLRKA